MTADYVLEATSDGVTIRTAIDGVGDGVLLVDQYLAPNGWSADFIPLMDRDTFVKTFTRPALRPEPVEEADLFVALRRAIVCDPQRDGWEDERVQLLVAHLEPHRPIQLFTGPEECLLAECQGHDGRCPDVAPADRLCRGCTAVYDTRSEYGPDFMTECRVLWPCPIVLAIADHYDITLEAVL